MGQQFSLGSQMLCKVSLHYLRLLCISQASETVEDPGAGHSETGGRPAGEVAHGLGAPFLLPYKSVKTLYTLSVNRPFLLPYFL